MKHQYGEVHYDYHQIMQIHEEGLQGGIDTIHMFGWWKGGMDNGNPDYVSDPELGGEIALQDGIERFQRNGNVILYANGRLIDLATDYYKDIGYRISVKDRFGAEIRDVYRFRGRGSFNGHFGNRTFTAACSCCPEWTRTMEQVVDHAADLGCRGVFFDQLGCCELACYDPAHGHRVPFLGSARQKAELVRILRDRVRSRSPDMAIGTEHLSDISAQHCDFIHSCPGYGETVNDWEHTGQKPRPVLFPEWFRYCFPEIILTDRGIRDDTDIERRVNHAVLMGLRSDVEIYRCRKTIVETPRYCDYQKAANEVRDRFAEFLLEGRYVDRDGFTINSEQIEARSYISRNRMAVVATQSHLPSVEAEIVVPGRRLAESGGLGEYQITAETSASILRLTVHRHALAVLVFER